MAYSGAKLLARELRRAPADFKAFGMEAHHRAGDGRQTRLDLVVRLLVDGRRAAVRRDAALSNAPLVLLERLERFLAERKKQAAVTRPRGETADAAEDAAAGALAVTPGWATGSFLALQKLSEWCSVGVGTEAMTATFPGWEKLGSPDGYLDAATRPRRGRACVRLLELTAAGENQGAARLPIPAPEPVPSRREPDGATVARTSDEEVGGVQAAMQLLVHLTKDHAIAARAHDEGVVGLILDLPARFAFPAYDALAASVLRHIVEDPHTLQLAMESEIHAVLSAADRPAPGLVDRSRRDASGGRADAKQVLAATLPVFLRDPACFLAALEKCAHMERSPGSGRRTIVLKSAAELMEAKDREREREGAPSGSSRPKGPASRWRRFRR